MHQNGENADAPTWLRAFGACGLVIEAVILYSF
jgi:hypothetical protein